MDISTAIKWLEQIKLCVHGGDEWFDGKRTEALDMAIQALKEKEVEPTKGEWEFFDYPYMGYRCSKCGAIGNYDHKFCHDCGIEMKVEPTEE